MPLSQLDEGPRGQPQMLISRDSPRQRRSRGFIQMRGECAQMRDRVTRVDECSFVPQLLADGECELRTVEGQGQLREVRVTVHLGE